MNQIVSNLASSLRFAFQYSRLLVLLVLISLSFYSIFIGRDFNLDKVIVVLFPIYFFQLIYG